MKTKLALLFFLFLTLASFSLASACDLSLDKGFLNFTLETEEVCKVVTAFSKNCTGIITVRDQWAETFDEEGNLYTYNFSAEDHGISISYIDTFLDFEDSVDFEICVIADSVGHYKGILTFTPEAEGMIVVEKSVWLYVHVEQPPAPETPQISTGRGGSSSSSKKTLSQNQTNATSGLEIQPLALENTSNKEHPQEPGITENIVNQDSPIKFWNFIPIIAIIGIIIATILVNKKLKKVRLEKK